MIPDGLTVKFYIEENGHVAAYRLVDEESTGCPKAVQFGTPLTDLQVMEIVSALTHYVDGGDDADWSWPEYVTQIDQLPEEPEADTDGLTLVCAGNRCGGHATKKCGMPEGTPCVGCPSHGDIPVPWVSAGQPKPRKAGWRGCGKPGWVYLARAPGMGAVKIGRTVTTVETRMDALSALLPESAEVIFSFQADDCSWLEKQLQDRFADKKIKRELYRLDEADIASVEGIVAELLGSSA